MLGRFLAWIIQNYKAVIAITSAFVAAWVTYIISPFFYAAASFILTMTQLEATVSVHTTKIDGLEKLSYKIDGRLEEIVKFNERLEKLNRESAIANSKVLKEVRQLRSNNE